MPHEFRYEFIRDLTPDRKLSSVWHFVPRRDSETEKPILTPLRQPDVRVTSWNNIFQGPATDVEIEVGSGKGGFLVEYASKHPELHILGSEWDASWAAYAGERLCKHGISNARMLRGDLFFFLRDRVPSNSVNAFHMYFPDPWPKKRQQKNRLMRADFLAEVARVLKPGSRLFYWGTDHQEYNAVAQDLFARTPNLRVLIRDVAEPTEGIMTNFEKKYRKEGRPIYRSVLEFQK
ncbi:MAG TPA: tRNA (guanine-N7)-methyltransferase [Fibrobacteraceae bacterium]|nr:tRNA (guanine-N7)-methyltransferase [Fibrobacteraceae bacterium]